MGLRQGRQQSGETSQARCAGQARCGIGLSRCRSQPVRPAPTPLPLGQRACAVNARASTAMGNGQMDRSLSQHGLTATAVALVLSLAISPPAGAQMAVYDAAAHAETSQTLAQALKLVDSAGQQLSQLTSLKDALGSVGASSGGLASPLRSLNASLTPPAMKFDGWNLPREMQSPNFGSMSSSRDFLGQALGVTPDKNNNIAYGDRDAAVQRRQLAVRDAAMNGYSLALAQRQQIQPALERAASLADQATSAATLMDQQRTTT